MSIDSENIKARVSNEAERHEENFNYYFELIKIKSDKFTLE